MVRGGSHSSTAAAEREGGRRGFCSRPAGSRTTKAVWGAADADKERAQRNRRNARTPGGGRGSWMQCILRWSDEWAKPCVRANF
mmetsp:Transcript_33597/g.66407  ORF Transcript_33597/g.66407 Transcript_33597/m.66407 type:complete len:84 (-) Transcript_33597:100-351(-)